MRRFRLIAAISALSYALIAPPADAQGQQDETPLEPDRPDLTNTPHLVGPGIVQIELGAIFIRHADSHTGLGSPATLRVGLADWVEARVGFDGLALNNESGRRETGIGNIQVAAKLRLWTGRDGVALLSALPSIGLPTASAAKGLGSGDRDYTVTFLTGTDVGSRAHLDVNYGIGAIGAGGGDPHFAQHVASLSLSFAADDQWSPYVEWFGISRQEAEGGLVSAIDTGAVIAIHPRLAVDAGLQFGVSRDAPAFAAFGGLSVAFGRSRAGSAPQAATRPSRYISFKGPRSRLRSSGSRPNRLPISRIVSSSLINAAPTASISRGVRVLSSIRRMA